MAHFNKNEFRYSLKYNNNKDRLGLRDAGRHFMKFGSLQEEVEAIDEWLADSECEVFITYKHNGITNESQRVNLDKMFTWFYGEGKGNWETYIFDFPISGGRHIYIHGKTGVAFYSNSAYGKRIPIDEKEIKIVQRKVK